MDNKIAIQEAKVNALAKELEAEKKILAELVEEVDSGLTRGSEIVVKGIVDSFTNGIVYFRLKSSFASMPLRVGIDEIVTNNAAVSEPNSTANSMTPVEAYEYARDVIKGRWPDGELVITRDSYTAYYYARDVINGRFPEGEAAIAKDPTLSYYYAKDVINGRFQEAEPVIAKDVGCAISYAKDIIKGRWTEAEPFIAEKPTWAHEYAEINNLHFYSRKNKFIEKD